MIIFINGTFGVGKTTIAELLASRIPNSLLYDPEEVGVFLRNVLGRIDPRDDFQHYPMWRTLTVETARLLLQTYGRTLIIPMTIWRQAYFAEVRDGLKSFEPELFHFCLTATEATHLERLKRRNDRQTVFEWCVQQAKHTHPTFQSAEFAVQIATDDRTPDEIAGEILKRTGLT